MTTHNYILVDHSQTEKTGNMPAVYASKSSCPPTCGLYAECYAKRGHAGIAFNRAANGQDFDALIDWVYRLPRGIWRYGVSGDLPGDGTTLDRAAVLQLARANRRREVLVYTHYRPTAENVETVRHAVELGFHINFSCDSLADIQAVVDAGLSTVTYTASTDTRKAWKQGGTRFVTCPNQSTAAAPKCIDCRLCARGDRGFTVVFRAHGTSKKRVEAVV